MIRSNQLPTLSLYSNPLLSYLRHLLGGHLRHLHHLLEGKTYLPPLTDTGHANEGGTGTFSLKVGLFLCYQF